MKIDVFTLFPQWFDWFGEQRHVQNARALGHELEAVDLRATTPLRAGQVDDTPYGGGAGMVLRVDVVEAALEARYLTDPVQLRQRRRVVALDAGGRQFDDGLAEELAAEPEITLLCGRYVLTGGELAAMVVSDAILRKLPGSLGHADSAVEESFSEALEGAPEYPHYTRPFEWRGHRVPDVLLSGNHAEIARWRQERSRERGEGWLGPPDG